MNHSGGRFHGDDARRTPPETRTRSQLIELGLTRSELSTALERGWLARTKRGIYALQVTELRLRLEVVLLRSPDAVFSHRTAAFAHGLKKREPAKLEVIVPRSRRSPRGAHGRSRREARRMTIAGVPFTPLAATIADLLDVWPERAVAESVDARFPTLDSRTAVLAEARELPGRQAKRVLPLLEWAPENMFSKVEGRLARALQMRGWTVRLNSSIGPYLWDIFIVEANLVVEFDSLKFHTDEQTFRVDRARQNNLVRRDVRILRYTDYDIDHRFDEVIAEIHDEARHLRDAPRTPRPSRTPRSPSRWDERHCLDLYLHLDVESDWRRR